MRKAVETYPRDFEGVWIPKEIYLNNNLNALEKIIFTEINSLDRHTEPNGDYCYASNEYLAKFCGCSKTKVSTAISTLIDLGYLRIVKTDGRKRWIESALKSCLSNFERQTTKRRKSNSQKMKESIIMTNTFNKTSMNTASSKNQDAEYSIDYVEKHIESICNKKGYVEECPYIQYIFKTYLTYYRHYLRQNHPRLSNRNLSALIDKLVGNISCTSVFDYDLYSDMIDKHFQIDYGKDIDYNINHFLSEGIIEKLECKQI